MVQLGLIWDFEGHYFSLIYSHYKDYFASIQFLYRYSLHTNNLGKCYFLTHLILILLLPLADNGL